MKGNGLAMVRRRSFGKIAGRGSWVLRHSRSSGTFGPGGLGHGPLREQQDYVGFSTFQVQSSILIVVSNSFSIQFAVKGRKHFQHAFLKCPKLC